jgi:DNA-binding CsgD family transcriptional regulator
MQAPRDRLTVKERVVTTLVWEGLTNRDIAERIHSSEQVVKNQLRSAFDKLGVWSRLELALYAASHGCGKWEGSLLAIDGAIEGAVEGAVEERSKELARERIRAWLIRWEGGFASGPRPRKVRSHRASYRPSPSYRGFWNG